MGRVRGLPGAARSPRLRVPGVIVSDEQALLAAIWAEPNDDTPRLAYADWLDETGDPARAARAEFVRLQVEMSGRAEDDPRFRLARVAANRLFRQWGKGWKAGLPRAVRGWEWRRGFPWPDDRGIDFGDLARTPVAELNLAPARGFSVMDSVRRFRDLLAWPHLDRLDTFYLRSGVPRGKWLPRALDCPGFRNVCRVSLIDCPIAVSQLETLLTAWQSRRIVDLQLNGSKIGDDGFGMILAHPVLACVRCLGVTGVGLTAAGVRLLARSAYHPPVPELNLSWNRFGDAGVAELVRWPGLARIRSLSLSHAEIGDAGAEALAACPALRSVREVRLGNNRIGGAGAEALAASPHLDRVTYLWLADNPLPAAAAARLRDRFGDRLKAPTH